MRLPLLFLLIAVLLSVYRRRLPAWTLAFRRRVRLLRRRIVSRCRSSLLRRFAPLRWRFRTPRRRFVSRLATLHGRFYSPRRIYSRRFLTRLRGRNCSLHLTPCCLLREGRGLTLFGLGRPFDPLLRFPALGANDQRRRLIYRPLDGSRPGSARRVRRCRLDIALRGVDLQRRTITKHSRRSQTVIKRSIVRSRRRSGFGYWCRCRTDRTLRTHLAAHFLADLVVLRQDRRRLSLDRRF
jgi:hypothetical protein